MFRFPALEAVILNKAMSLVVVASAPPFRATSVPLSDVAAHWPVIMNLLAAMVAHPVLVNRPIVATPKGVRLRRPSERTLDLLEKWPPGPFAKEDGELIIDASGRRVA